MNWRKRVKRMREWLAVLAEEGRQASWLGMAKALLSGRVDRSTWRQRMRTCLRCPVYDRELKRCRARIGGTQLGCGCYCPYLALSAVPPYPGGCWGFGRGIGWPAVAQTKRF